MIGNVEDSHNGISMATPSKPMVDPNQKPFNYRDPTKYNTGVGTGVDEDMFQAIEAKRTSE